MSEKQPTKENAFDMGIAGTTGAMDYSAGFGTFASPDASQNPAAFLNSKALGSHSNTATNAPAQPMDTDAAIDQIYSKEVTPSPDEVKAALQNGYGIILCSDVGYNNTRDRLAFLKRQGSWSHCMACLGWRPASSGREGFLIAQSWGNDWANGPIYPSDCIYGGFWITPDDLKAHLRSEDCYAIAGFEGFKKRNLKWDEIFKIGEKINVEDN